MWERHSSAVRTSVRLTLYVGTLVPELCTSGQVRTEHGQPGCCLLITIHCASIVPQRNPHTMIVP